MAASSVRKDGKEAIKMQQPPNACNVNWGKPRTKMAPLLVLSVALGFMAIPMDRVLAALPVHIPMAKDNTTVPLAKIWVTSQM